MIYPLERNLDPVYFRVERDGRWRSLCFTDLTEEEREAVMDGKDARWLRRMAGVLAGSLRDLGDSLDVERVRQGEL